MSKTYQQRRRMPPVSADTSSIEVDQPAPAPPTPSVCPLCTTYGIPIGTHTFLLCERHRKAYAGVKDAPPTPEPAAEVPATEYEFYERQKAEILRRQKPAPEREEMTTEELCRWLHRRSMYVSLGPEHPDRVHLLRAVATIERLAAEVSAFREQAEEAAFMRGVASVLAIRCTKHIAVPQMNAQEESGAECAACAVDREIAALRARLAEGERERDHHLREVETLTSARDALLRTTRLDSERERELERALSAAREREAGLREAARGGSRWQFVLMHASGCPFVTQSAACECGLDRFRRALADGGGEGESK